MKWTRDREGRAYVAVSRHTEGRLTKGVRGWCIDLTGNFGRKPFLDSNGTDTLAHAKLLAEQDMARWDREIDLQGGPSKWR